MTTFEVLGPERLAELSGPLHEMYRLCFAEPPWSETAEQLDAHPEVLARELARPGMSGIVALDGPTVAAVVYGWPAGDRLPDEPVFRRLALPAGEQHHLLAPAVKVQELMVHPGYRRLGLARRLLDRFIAGHPKAWLSTHPDAPARSLYEATGWRPLVSFSTPSGRPGVIYTRTASAPDAPNTGSTARMAVPESSLR